MDLELSGKVAVVTGGSKGIGYATAHLLVREGATVVIVARREAALAEAAADIARDTSETIGTFAIDVAKPEDLDRLTEWLIVNYGLSLIHI